jgi:hypothetical protein
MAKDTASTTTPDVSADLFDDARGSDFVRPEDVDGRALVVWPVETGTAKGDNGADYDWVQVEFIALDGENTDKVTVGEPNEMRFTSAAIVGQLKRKVGSGKPTLGRIDSRKSRFRTPAYGFQPIDNSDPIRGKAARAVETYNKTRTAADPFAV